MAGFEFCGFEISEIRIGILVSLRLDFWLGCVVLIILMLLLLIGFELGALGWLNMRFRD